MPYSANRTVAKNGGLVNKRDPDQPDRAKRRTFDGGFKLRVLEEWDRADVAERSAILRREGLYSMIADWQRQHRQGLLKDGAGHRRRPRRPQLPRSPGSAARTASCRTSWPRPRSSSTSREKCTRSWRRSRRARPPTTTRRDPRRRRRRARPGDRPPSGLRGAGPPRATHYRHRRPPLHGPPAPRPRSPRALQRRRGQTRSSTSLNTERFCDQAPAQVWATLLDEGTYLASISTMYRLLRARAQVRERRRIARRPRTVKPELVATAPNQVWSWDITKLAGPHKWTWFHLYVILDVYSRYAVGWLVAPRESARLAEELIADAIHDHGVGHGQLTLHADRGTLDDLQDRHPAPRRPRRAADPTAGRTSPTTTPTAKPNFKTLKYFPTLPQRFASIAARPQLRRRLLRPLQPRAPPLRHRPAHPRRRPLRPTPTPVRAQRQAVLDAAYAAHPERFRRPPRAPQIPDIVGSTNPRRRHRRHRHLTTPVSHRH